MTPPYIFLKVLPDYGIGKDAVVEPYGSGLINHTWKISGIDKEYILQQINHDVFREPQHIAGNIRQIAAVLEKSHPDYCFVSPVPTIYREDLLHIDGKGYFRLFPFIKGSRTYNVASKSGHAYEAARQFGLFTRVLAGFPAARLHITLPAFHDLGNRYQAFEVAIRHGNPRRVQESAKTIKALCSYSNIVTTWQQLLTNPAFRLRVTHHDTKISNVLFDEEEKGICVIDLDTVMPGYFISDVGDMMRTYLSPVSEEEKDVEKIRIREEYFHAIVQGYLQEMSTELSETEIRHFVYAGLFMTYMQALRFLTDHLEDDRYYGASYEGHNYVRAQNQLTLLERLLEKEAALNEYVMDTARLLQQNKTAIAVEYSSMPGKLL